ncbi:MAG: hypothetical protein ACTTHU_05510 [Treponema sp.]
MDYKILREEPLKSAVREDYFSKYKYTQIGNIDFVIAKHITENRIKSLFEELENDDLKSILWAEAKQGTTHDIYESFVQLILTIGKEKTFEKYIPPKYIGAFDAEKIAFIEYHNIQEVFYQNDFNWNVTPSNHETKEFKQLYALCKNLLTEHSIFFKYETQPNELKQFIKLNFKTDKDISEKISVTKNNFTFVFQRWTEVVKPTISVDWEKAKKIGIISADFFLADLLSNDNESLKDSLYVVLKKTKYELAKKSDDLGFETSMSVGFNDKQKAYKEFWSIYSRPPKEEYWDYIIGRRDLLVPQDIRERKGSFFTPQIWVEKSQQYLADVLGETWQDEYYIWDCCAGTGNLLNGLTNYRNVFASTLDKQDVDVMKDRIANGWNMFENHVFQFDFLNDAFSKCPEELQEILNSAEKRKKLVIYINPPYAETDNRKSDRSGVKDSDMEKKYREILGNAGNELYAQFLIRIYKEIPNIMIAHFSKLKHLQSPNFKIFRTIFTPKFEKMFAVPAWTFDNVTGEYPIGFMIWDSSESEKFAECKCDVFNAKGELINEKVIISYDNVKLMNDWIAKFKTKGIEEERAIGLLNYTASDFQQQKYTALISGTKQMGHNSKILAFKENLFPVCIYFTVRLSIEPTWLNDRDQFLYPNDGWQNDKEFQSNCLIYTLFHGQNRISSDHGTNHWIPFSEQQVGCKKAFKSNFMSKFLNGEVEFKKSDEWFSENEAAKSEKVVLSEEAQNVYNAGLELWKYYHLQPKANPDASYYDIRKFFQGETKGRMNNGSSDEKYMELIGDVRNKMKLLAKKIESKVYEYGFLKQ